MPVPPQEARAASEHARGDDSRVEEALVAIDVGAPEADEADDDEGRESEDRRAGGEPVQAIGEVHGVRRREDQEDREQRPADRAQI